MVAGESPKTAINARLGHYRLFRAQFDSALRIGDLLSFDFRRLTADGRAAVTQAKTGRVHQIQFRASTLAAIAETMKDDPGREKIWPLTCNRSCFFRKVRAIVKAAGVRKGTSKWLRRSSASYVERQSPGTAWRHLGHAAPGLDRKHYLDPTIAFEPPPLPPDIG